IPRPELQPGSSEPAGRAEIDALLTAVPELAFMPEFEGCVPTLDGVTETSHEDADNRMSDVRGVATVLHTLSKEATSQANGGLLFLVRTLLHFIEVQAVPPSQHPLIVALYLRGSARCRGETETPASVAAAMDHWR
ncbi:MAG: hypothetical protein KUG77_07910, partial [Nannocystaceae bacterium]|nr:hypothetical protein [Nannocystaceae bacterium]